MSELLQQGFLSVAQPPDLVNDPAGLVVKRVGMAREPRLDLIQPVHANSPWYFTISAGDRPCSGIAFWISEWFRYTEVVPGPWGPSLLPASKTERNVPP